MANEIWMEPSGSRTLRYRTHDNAIRVINIVGGTSEGSGTAYPRGLIRLDTIARRLVVALGVGRDVGHYPIDNTKMFIPNETPPTGSFIIVDDEPFVYLPASGTYARGFYGFSTTDL